jgi:hypothetical protein
MRAILAMPYDTNVWYHATDGSYLYGIANDGLQPRSQTSPNFALPAEEGAVYLWPTAALAYSWSVNRPWSYKGPKANPVVLRATGIDQQQLAPDHEVFRNDVLHILYDEDSTHLRDETLRAITPYIEEYMGENGMTMLNRDDLQSLEYEDAIEILRSIPTHQRTELARELSNAAGAPVMYYGSIPPEQIDIARINLLDHEIQWDIFHGENPEWDANRPEEDEDDYIERMDEAFDEWLMAQGDWIPADEVTDFLQDIELVSDPADEFANYMQFTPLPEHARQQGFPGFSHLANIFDPIQKVLDQKVYNDETPKPSIVNFIRKIYYRAFAREFGASVDPEELVALYLTGSLTTYQYSDTSDADVSVFPEYDRAWELLGLDPDQFRKRLIALSIEHIDGTPLPGSQHPLQFFVVPNGIIPTDLYQPGLRSAYSLQDLEWVVPPERDRVHDIATELPEPYRRASDMADKMTEMLDHDPEQARELWKQIHKKRQLDQRAGLGDFSEGNIVYKYLLHQGLFDRIKSELHEYIAKTADLRLLPGGGEGGMRFKVNDAVRHRTDKYRQRGYIVQVDPEDETYLVQFYPLDSDPEYWRDDDLVPIGYGGPRVAVDWSGDDLDPRTLDNRDYGMEAWERLEQQIVQLAHTYDAKIEWLPRNRLQRSIHHTEYQAPENDTGIDWDNIQSWSVVEFPHITGLHSYLVALHEIGHAAFARLYNYTADTLFGRSNSQEEELWAWHFAIENAQMEIPTDVLEWGKKMFSTYEHSTNVSVESDAYPGWLNTYDHKQINEERRRGDLPPINPNYPLYSKTARVLEPEERLKLERHLEQLAEGIQMEVAYVDINVWASRMWQLDRPVGWGERKFRGVCVVPPLTSDLTYFVAMHEIGHAYAGFHQDASYENELWTNHWVLENSLIPVDMETLQNVSNSLRSYDRANYPELGGMDWIQQFPEEQKKLFDPDYRRQVTDDEIIRATDIGVDELNRRVKPYDPWLQFEWKRSDWKDDRVTVRVIYDFDKDRIVLGTQALEGDMPAGKIIGDYSDGNVTLYNVEKQWVSPSYFRRLWAWSFPSRPLKKIQFKEARVAKSPQAVLDQYPGKRLINYPGPVNVPGHGSLDFGAHSELQDLAGQYADISGLNYDPPRDYAHVDPERAKRIADEYEKMEHNPRDPAVAASYDAFIKETMAQYQWLMDHGYTFEFYPAEDPYPNGPREALLDLYQNKHLYVFPTSGGFGQTEVEEHPLLEYAGIEWNGQPVTYNDIFRGVHDVFGHAKEGVGFRADGEENAWRQHATMYSELARPAMTAETRGQNSWVNFGPHGEQNQKADQMSTTYAEQKAGILPSWAQEEGFRHTAMAFSPEWWDNYNA